MPRNRFVAPLARLFDGLLFALQRVYFAGVHLAALRELSVDETRALLLVANHSSWWDGFFLRAVQRRLRPSARLTTVMLERQLARFPFFRWMGVLGIDPRSVGSVRRLFATLAATRAAHGAGTTVAFFPQGRIWPATKRPLVFQRGVVHIAERLAPATILPVAIRLESLADMRPHAFVLVGAPIMAEGGGGVACVERIEHGVAVTLDHLNAFLDEHGEEAARRWSAVSGATAPPARRPSCREAR